LATRLHPALRLRINGAIPLLLLYAFMAWKAATGSFTFYLAYKPIRVSLLQPHDRYQNKKKLAKYFFPINPPAQMYYPTWGLHPL
jgi:hypothetical protein